MSYLNKSITDPNTGTVVKCWALKSISYDAASDSSLVIYSGWIDHTARETGKAPVMFLTWTIHAGTSPQLSGAVQAFAKASALQQPLLTGATEAPNG